MGDLTIEKPLPGEVIDSPFHKGNVVGVIRYPGGGRTFFSDYALPKTKEENEKRRKEFSELATRLLHNHYMREHLNSQAEASALCKDGGQKGEHEDRNEPL